MALTGFATSSHATFPDLHSMLEAFAPQAPANAPELNNLILSINSLAPFPEVQYNALLTLVPLADGSLRAASDGPMWQILSVIAERLLTVDRGEETGYAAGDEGIEDLQKLDPFADHPHKETTENDAKPAVKKKQIPLSQAEKVHAVWGQLLGDHIDQEIRGGLPAYDADVLGGVIGRDLFLAPNLIVGVAGAYQHARVDQQDLSGSFFTINRYQGTVYGRYHLCDWPAYIVGAVTLAANRYENSRYILVIPTNGNTAYSVIANSEFTGWESDVYLEQGYVWKCGNFRVIPKLILMFSHLDIESYDESDAFELDLTVKYQDMNELMVGGGFKFDYRNLFPNAYVIPEAHAYYFYDCLNDSQTATAQFFSGGYAFLSQGAEPAPDTFIVGASLAVHSYLNTVVKLEYDYTARTDYHRQAAFIKIRHEWA